MKIESIRVQGFKCFDNLELSFTNKTLDEVSDRFLILGDNGAGKTTLLQAIALPIAMAMRHVDGVADFDWIGFVAGRHMRHSTPLIELHVCFSQDEVSATREVAHRWYDAQSENFKAAHPFTEPDDATAVTLRLYGEKCTAESYRKFLLFQGRSYAKRVLKTDPSVRKLFSRLPGLFWFDQYRNLASPPPDWAEPLGANGTETKEGRLSFEVGVAQLRKHLNGWKLAKQDKQLPPDESWLDQLEALYKKVFPGRRFSGVEQMPGVASPTLEDFYFLLHDGKHEYDVVEMSAGEQAVFPMLYEFVRQQIANSVVLIDEVDLNLHPPAAQLLVSQLKQIGPTCQFILTTHSECVSDIIGEDDTSRLPGGMLCL